MTATAQAADYTVTKLADDGTDGTLRKEILDANATAIDDRILFQAGLSGTITLTTGEILIGDALEIVGPGANSLTVSGNDASRIFSVGPTVDAVTISGLKLTGGGGGPIGAGIINSTADLTLTRSVMSGNHGIGGGTRGGAIANLGGTLKISNSTFSGNSAGVAGGAIYTYNSPTTIENSTISGNAAGEGAGLNHYSNGVDPLTIRSSTIAGNEGIQSGAGIYLATSGLSALTNTIVADNVAPAQPDLGGNTVFDASFSLVENAPSLNETVPDSNITGVDPRLESLASNGGPTATQAPALGSPAVDAGSASGPFDQLGLTRPVDLPGIPNSSAAGANGADMGAVELQFPSNDFTLGALKRHRKKGTATLAVTVPGAGRLNLAGAKVKAATKNPEAAGIVKLLIRAKGKAAKRLRRTGKTSARARVTFTPTAGNPRTKSRVVRLVKRSRR
jgi:hypothetical protein